jgi:hypothetical protein
MLRFIYLSVLVLLLAAQNSYSIPVATTSEDTYINIAGRYFDDEGHTSHVVSSSAFQYHKQARQSNRNTHRVFAALDAGATAILLKAGSPSKPAYVNSNTVYGYSIALLLIYPHHYFW